MVTWPEQKAFLQSWLQMGTKKERAFFSVSQDTCCLPAGHLKLQMRRLHCSAVSLAGRQRACGGMHVGNSAIRPVHDHTGRQSLTHIPHLE